MDGEKVEGERGTYKTSGARFAKLFRRRTTRHATIYGRVGWLLVVEGQGRAGRTVQATAAGALKKTLMTEFRLRSMNMVAMRLETKLVGGKKMG